MKAFKGTIIAAALLAVVLLLVWFVEKPPVDQPKKPKTSEERPLYTFEKQDLVRVQVKRPDGTEVALKEEPSGWIIEGDGFPASRTMVNRVKHQIHDLTARARVIENPEDPALYGLAAQAVEVTLTLRDGQQIQFRAGDPNPSGVSYYIQPIPGEDVYTVKKSAVDYYSLSFDEFRERRFASFDSKDADGIEADLPGGKRLKMQKSGEDQWELLEPYAMRVSRDSARSLLGRVAVLKAQEFVHDFPDTETADLAQYGLEPPRARITIRFASRDPLVLRVGSSMPNPEGDEELAYMILEGDRTVYAARVGLLEDFTEDPATFRLREIMRISGVDVVEVDATLNRPVNPGDSLSGQVHLRQVGDTWQWDDGLPVPGSTPRRLAMRAAGVEAEEFVDDHPSSVARYGLDKPLATITVKDQAGTTRTLLIGDMGPSRQGPEEHLIERAYARIDGEEPVYLVEKSVLEVLEDALREHGRKAEKDDEMSQRHEAMDDARRQNDQKEAP